LALEKLKTKEWSHISVQFYLSNSKSLKKVCQTFKSELSKSGRSEERKKAGNRLEQRPRWYTHSIEILKFSSTIISKKNVHLLLSSSPLGCPHQPLLSLTDSLLWDSDSRRPFGALEPHRLSSVSSSVLAALFQFQSPSF
jgi:hypothetical protein